MRLTGLAFSITWTSPTDVGDFARCNVTVTESVSGVQWTAVVNKTNQSQCYQGLDSSKTYTVSLTIVYADGSYVTSVEQIIPSGGGGGSVDECPEIIPGTGVCTAVTV